MIIKLDTSAFRLVRPRAERTVKVSTPLTRAQWINADRIVMAGLFAAAAAGAVLF